MAVRIITIDHIQFLAHDLAQKTLTWVESIPEFHTRFPHILESCVATPFMRVAGHDLYKGLIRKAAVFLYLNKAWIWTGTEDLYHLARWVADSPSKLKDDVIALIVSFIKKHLIKIEL